MKDYKCTVCSYIYRPTKGDWTHNVKTNTAFEELPEGWRCPTCNQPKMAFIEKDQ